MIKNIENSSLKEYLLNEKNLQKENGIEDAVRKIILAVKDSGNESLLSCINKYEEKNLKTVDEVLFDQNN